LAEALERPAVLLDVLLRAERAKSGGEDDGLMAR